MEHRAHREGAEIHGEIYKDISVVLCENSANLRVTSKFQ